VDKGILKYLGLLLVVFLVSLGNALVSGSGVIKPLTGAAIGTALFHAALMVLQQIEDKNIPKE
jgi:hypothetical protein